TCFPSTIDHLISQRFQKGFHIQYRCYCVSVLAGSVSPFVAGEGICYLPHWMLQNLLLGEHGLVKVKSVNLMVMSLKQPYKPNISHITFTVFHR
uniref:Ubiquitin fusion degradation protein UFD1 N-terminal subdomain 1 domain-containing protein n=1 Tax=Anabas testudineus TaxID=64144 RepID=A0A7N6C0P9_ANATE